MIASQTWQKMAAEVQHDLDRGIPWRDIHQLHIAVNMTTMESYEYYAQRLDAALWPAKRTEPLTIIEVGPGYGAMAGYWPEGSFVFNVDLPPMLELQQRYHRELGRAGGLKPREIAYLPIDKLPEQLPKAWQGAYLFSSWALTETTPEMWEYWTGFADQLAGAYVIGYRRWVDEAKDWPWQELADQFGNAVLVPDTHFPPCNALELLAFNG